MKLKVISGKFKGEVIETVEENEEIVKQIIPEKILEWGKTSGKEMNWKDAKEWCEKQGDGWRLPTLIELMQAHEDKIAGFVAGNYWSSAENSASYAWDSTFGGGNPNHYNKTHSYYVRCVRG